MAVPVGAGAASASARFRRPSSLDLRLLFLRATYDGTVESAGFRSSRRSHLGQRNQLHVSTSVLRRREHLCVFWSGQLATASSIRLDLGIRIEHDSLSSDASTPHRELALSSLPPGTIAPPSEVELAFSTTKFLSTSQSSPKFLRRPSLSLLRMASPLSSRPRPTFTWSPLPTEHYAFPIALAQLFNSIVSSAAISYFGLATSTARAIANSSSILSRLLPNNSLSSNSSIPATKSTMNFSPCFVGSPPSASALSAATSVHALSAN